MCACVILVLLDSISVQQYLTSHACKSFLTSFYDPVEMDVLILFLALFNVDKFRTDFFLDFLTFVS